VRLLDFGLAKHVGAEASEAQTATTPGVVMGTFGYMSPEQLSGGTVDERTDLFSVGVCAAEAISGGRPFKGRTLLELLNSMERDEFTPDAEGPEAARLAEVIRRALSKEPARRFASAEEMRRELVAALKACTAPAPDADTVMFERLNAD
jgi:serine/threonine-protein kinase